MGQSYPTTRRLLFQPPSHNETIGQYPTLEQQREYVRRWKHLGPILERLRDEEVRQADTPTAIQIFHQAFRIALRDLPPRESSGLLEWQRYMQLWRKRG